MQTGIWLGGSVFLIAANTLQGVSKITEPYLLFQAAALSITLLLSFINFALVIRYSSHTGLLIGSMLPPAQAAEVVVPPNVSIDAETGRRFALHAMTRMSSHFFLGFRMAYLSVPFALMVLGPTALLVSTLLIVLMFVYMDNPGSNSDAAAVAPDPDV
jgi:uncharacterized membrane protein